MGKIEFNVNINKRYDSESDEDTYEKIINQTTTEFDDEQEDDISSEDDTEEDSIYTFVDISKLAKVLRNELGKPEYSRDYLSFRYKDEQYEGIPLHEINPKKFVFNINGKLKGINLEEIIVL